MTQIHLLVFWILTKIAWHCPFNNDEDDDSDFDGDVDNGRQHYSESFHEPEDGSSPFPIPAVNYTTPCLYLCPPVIASFILRRTIYCFIQHRCSKLYFPDHNSRYLTTGIETAILRKFATGTGILPKFGLGNAIHRHPPSGPSIRDDLFKNVWERPLSWHANCSLPVSVCDSKSSLLSLFG